jgi:hypothetical protein
MAHSVKTTQLIPVKDLVEGLLGMRGDFRSGVEQASSSPSITEVNGLEVFCAHAEQEQSSMTASFIHK